MNSRTSWSVDGIDPKVRERAEAAAHRAGLSLSDWLKLTIPETSSHPKAAKPLPAREAEDVAEIHSRLDSITRQIEQMSSPAPRGDIGVARQLNDAISRLDARLSQIGEPASPVVSTASRPMMASPSISPDSLDAAIAEIAARQSELSGRARHAAPVPVAVAVAPVMAQPKPSGPDFSILEKHLQKITGQIEALQRPDSVEQSIETFRGELADIRNVITEAMPRRAIESIENEIRSLSRRIDDSRQSGIDGQSLAGIERALADIKDALRSLTPAEQLAGFDDAIRNLGGKIDLIVRANDDPGTIEQLHGAIAALRAIVSNVASNEALGRLSDDVRMLASKVDQVGRPDAFGESFAVLEQRIATLTTTLEKRPQGVMSGHSEHLEGALQALSDRLDHLPVGNDSTSAFAHLEQRVSYLLERLETNNDHRANNFGRVEEGLQDILRHLERQSESIANFASPSIAPSLPAMDPTLVNAIKRDLSDMRFSQTETDRHTQDSLEVVHNTLGHVVDRLAMIEGDLRAARAASVPIATPVMTATPRPELPNPAAKQLFVAEAPAFAPAALQNNASAAAAMAAPRAISDILDQQSAPSPPRASTPIFEPQQRSVMHPDLPPDHPLEPGTTPHGRIALSSDRISDIPADAEPASTSSFIAAARRAAQAAAAATPANDKTNRAANAAGGKNGEASTITTKIRSLLVGASVVVIVLGSFKMAMNLLDGSTSTPTEAVSEAPAPMTLAPPESSSRPAIQPPGAPSMTSPTPIGRQSLVAPQPEQPFAGVPMPAPIQLANADVTGSIPQQLGAASSLPQAGRKPATVAIPASEKLPDAIAGPILRAAALKGDPAAAYEIGLRYAEARGVPANFDEAAKWYDRAAQAGIVPAMFRIGTLYEKGMSVKKDPDIARKFYAAAAERGNAKAMHNLAVLDADGGGNGANYKSAAQWFRKAADRGVADSQYNLGILYARGIGVEQNLAESYKWFSLAAAQGDQDSGTKRDDITKRLDPQSLAAAKLAIQTFTPEPQPNDAIIVASPAGGWDNAGSPPAKPASAKRAAR